MTQPYMPKSHCGGRLFLAAFIFADFLLTVALTALKAGPVLLAVKYLTLCVVGYISYEKLILPAVNHQLWQRVQDHVSYINFLERINHIMVSHLDFRESFAAFIEELRGQVEFDRCLVYRVNMVKNQYQLHGYFDGTGAQPEEMEVRPLHGSLIEEVVKKQRSGVYTNLNGHGKLGGLYAAGIRSLVLIPMVYNGQVLGVFLLAVRNAGQYKYADLEMLSPIVERLTLALQNCLLYQETKELSLKDYLTDTANRRALDLRLEYEYSRAKRYDEPFSVLVIDIDHFKPFNDTYGHLAGDDALRELAEIMKAEVREVDLVSRFGGEEFVILLPGTNREQAWKVAERIRCRVSEHTFLQGRFDAQLTVCIGVATYSAETDGIAELLRGADLNLYSAKSCGRNQVVQVG